MKAKEKAVVAFLVSLGFFTATQASAYVSGLSAAQKKAMALAAANSVDTTEVPGVGPSENLPDENK